MKKEILILGLGNDILTDDGIGPKLSWYLKEKISNPKIQFDTAAVGGMELIEIIRDYSHVIIIDAIMTRGGVPGDVYYLTPENFKETSNISNLHDISFLQALELAKRLDVYITAKIDIIAIEIIEDRIYSNDFTEPLQARYEEIKSVVLNMVNELLVTNGC